MIIMNELLNEYVSWAINALYEASLLPTIDSVFELF